MSSRLTPSEAALVTPPPGQSTLSKMSESDRLMAAAKASAAASASQSLSNTLKSRAASLTDPRKREEMMREAYNKELEAYGNSKKARILKSGTFQGAAGGAGIGAATGLGLGTAVGTLVGGVASIPTTLVGGLVGSGVGLVHGPWVKLGKWEKKDGGEGSGGGGGGGEEGLKAADGGRIFEVPVEAVESGAVGVDEKTGTVSVRDREALERAERNARAMEGGGGGADVEKVRRKPKKLEVRSKQHQQQQQHQQRPSAPAQTESQGGTAKSVTPTTAAGEVKARKKPAKLEIRNKTKQAA